MIGLLIGAIFVQYASWKWIFWFAAMICIPTAAMSFVAIPTEIQPGQGHRARAASNSYASRFARLDLFGVSILTLALILLIFSLTSASAAGWGSAHVLVPLIASLIMIVGFFFYERTIPEDRAAV